MRCASFFYNTGCCLKRSTGRHDVINKNYVLTGN
jgi:hypothetical protein